MTTEAAKVGVEIEALVYDLYAARTPEMDVGGDLAERCAGGEKLDDVMLEFGGAACLDPPGVAGPVFHVRGGRRDVGTVAAARAAAHADADHIQGWRAQAVLKRGPDSERGLKAVRIDVGGQQRVGSHASARLGRAKIIPVD